MIPKYRKAFNENFTQEAYEALLKETNEKFNYTPKFKIAETPVFIANQLKERLIEACNDIMKVINQLNFKALTEGAFFYESMKVPNEDEHSKFIQFDFGICLDENGEPTPKLIELQGFLHCISIRIFWENFIKNITIYQNTLPFTLLG